ncbi:hypothetical protein WJX72_012428 [[Myrmecia] bisecta]|uniref:Uncharacterized protein n=1 Tax=[Myrmecia] bisecta TaxID=41462 RepID=A0AAW1PKA5_9CHLO
MAHTVARPAAIPGYPRPNAPAAAVATPAEKLAISEYAERVACEHKLGSQGATRHRVSLWKQYLLDVHVASTVAGGAITRPDCLDLLATLERRERKQDHDMACIVNSSAIRDHDALRMTLALNQAGDRIPMPPQVAAVFPTTLGNSGSTAHAQMVNRVAKEIGVRGFELQ